MSSEVDLESVRQQRKDWAETLQIAVELYCSDQNYSSRSLLRDKLGISRSAWDIITGAKGVTDAGTYAILFYETGIVQADPRTLPLRVYKTPNGEYTFKSLAMSEVEWNAWKEEYERLKAQDAQDVRNSQPPAQVEVPRKPAVQPTSVVTSTFAKQARFELDSFFERFMSMVVPRNVDYVDSSAVDQLLWAMKGVFEELGKATAEERSRFSVRHGRILALLLSYFEVYSHPEEKKREQMLSMMGFGKGESHLE